MRLRKIAISTLLLLLTQEVILLGNPQAQAVAQTSNGQAFKTRIRQDLRDWQSTHKAPPSTGSSSTRTSVPYPQSPSKPTINNSSQTKAGVQVYRNGNSTQAYTAPSPSVPNIYSPQSPQVFEGYIWPAQGQLSSGYGWRWGKMHKGIDIAAPIGTPVVAAASGVVTYSRWNEWGFGNLVEITHPDGSTTLYAHNDRLMVREGQQVRQGQLIAQVGSTGNSTGPHLHFEIHPSGKAPVDPLAYLPR